jgi:hypothetical protein
VADFLHDVAPGQQPGPVLRDHRALSWPTVAALIEALFRISRPTAIAGFVMAIIVDAVQGSPGRTIAHVSQECLERLTPSLADGNAPAAIPEIGAMAGVGTSLNHPMPRAVRPCSAAALSVPVLYWPLPAPCVPTGLAPARFAVGQLAATNLMNYAAGASAVPVRMSPPHAGKGHDVPQAKRSACKVYKSGMSVEWGWGKIVLSHVRPPRQVGLG